MLDDPFIGLQYWNNGLDIEVRERNPRDPITKTYEPPDGIDIIQYLARRVVGLQENAGLNFTDAKTPHEDAIDDAHTRHISTVDRSYSRDLIAEKRVIEVLLWT
ncbi:hypothetical protein VCV18_011463 [Metarhizium anisopliae]